MKGYIIQLATKELVCDRYNNVIVFPEKEEATSELTHTFKDKGTVLNLVRLWKKRGPKKKAEA